MIRHIVFFKIKDFSSDEERIQAKENLLLTFRGLIGQIPQTRKYLVEEDLIQGPSSFDVVVDSSFDSLEDLKAYQNHPAHLDAVQEAKQWFSDKAVVDYKLSE